MAKRKLNFTDTDEDRLMKEHPLMHVPKKLKLTTRYFIKTVNENGNSAAYEMDTSHKLFNTVINAFKTNEIKEEDDCCENEVALFNVMIDGYYAKNDDALLLITKSSIAERYQCEDSSREALEKFLGIDFEEKDFYGFIKEIYDDDTRSFSMEIKRILLEGHVLDLNSYC